MQMSRVVEPKVLGVLAGEDFPLDRLATWANGADFLIAADGGSNRLGAAGFRPHVIVGDLDSVTEPVAGVEVVKVSEQDSSDCDKLLRFAADRGFPSITLISIEGDQLDHVLGTLSSALRASLPVRLALRRGVAWVLRPGDEIAFEATQGTRISLMPLTACDEVDLFGVEWPLDRAALSPDGLVSLSNRAKGGMVRAFVGKGGAALFVSGADWERPFWPGTTDGADSS